jgi:threonine dehydrogenase-like Zn-dependent dehydrogenase
MQAIAIVPGQPGSIHRRQHPRPRLEDVPDGTGVRVRLIRAGLCGTDADLAAGEYGRAPEGDDYLVLGHESLGRVHELGPVVPASDGITPGQLVVVTIRRRGTSAYDDRGRPDLSTDAVFTETGISRAHGFMTEEVVAAAEYLVPVPDGLEPVAILTEPLSCVTKALRQADQVQTRLGAWAPRRALVLGASTIGLLATLVLRLRGLEVDTVGRRPRGAGNSALVAAIGGRYVSAADAGFGTPEHEAAYDIVFEGSGDPTLLEPAVAALAPNGVLAAFSVTPGSRRVSVDVARLNQALVLYNRVIVGSAAAAWDDYASAVHTLAQAEAEPATRGWLAQLLTGRIQGLDAEAIAAHLAGGAGGIKTTVELG